MSTSQQRLELYFSILAYTQGSWLPEHVEAAYKYMHEEAYGTKAASVVPLKRVNDPEAH